MSSSSTSSQELITSLFSNGQARMLSMQETTQNALQAASSKASQAAAELTLIEEFATCCTIVAVMISGYQIIMHLRHFNEQQIQLQIIRILLIIPVYSIATWLSIMIPEETLTFNTIRDIYEAYVLYIFMQLLVNFLGGENQLIVHLEFKRRIKQPWPLDGLRPLQTDKIFYRRIKQGVLQFVLIKPITAVLAIALEQYDVYDQDSFTFKSSFVYLAFINNCSVSLSLYCLVLFYMATEERLKPFSPFSKFLCVKAILFFSFWQTLLFSLLIHFEIISRENGDSLLNLITCAELVVAAVAQSIAFSYRGFLEYDKSPERNVIKTIGQIIFAKDVINDAHTTFIRDYQDEEDQETQMDLLKNEQSAFNWSDDENDNDDIEEVRNNQLKQKYTKKHKQSTFKTVKQKISSKMSASPASLNSNSKQRKQELSSDENDEEQEMTINLSQNY